MADVKGGRGVTGMSFSGKGNLEKPSSGKLARELGSTVSKTTSERTSGSYPRIGFGAITPPGTSSRMLAQKFSTKYKPGEYAAYRKAMAAKKPVVKPVVKPAAQVISNVTSEKPSPTKKATPRAKPPATRFGTVTGKTTGTTMRSGGGGYGGGGTRGGGSLSGGGSGTRSAGTSRTGGTQRNDPVRG
jgi:hypothetical protein